MKVLIVLLMLWMATEGVMAARWEKAEVPVWDFTPEEWRGAVQDTVDDFNANLPEGLPRLNHIPMGELPCSALPAQGKKGGISVCKGEGDLSEASSRVRGSTFLRVKIALTGVGGPVMCHEFTHAVFDSPDDVSRPHPEDSCVQGYLNHLGSWDIAYAKKVYKRHRR